MAPARMTESNMTMLSRTTAPMSTRTPGDRIGTLDGAGHEAAVADEAVVDVGGRPDARRRALLGPRVDEPVAVVQVELGSIDEQVHVGLPIALDGPDILPVAVEAIAEDTGPGVEHGGDDVAARSRVSSSLSQRRSAFLLKT